LAVLKLLKKEINMTKPDIYQLHINDMSCQHCVNRVIETAQNIEGVQTIEVDLENAQALVKGGTPEAVIQAITEAGYPASLKPDTTEPGNTDTGETAPVKKP
jgi:Cu+-exporting ATPase